MEIVNLIKRLKDNNIDLALLGSDIEINYDGDELPDVFFNEVLANKTAIINFLRISGSDKNVSIQKIEPQSHYILSSSQYRLWILSQFEDANVAYNMPGVYVFEGALDRSGLEDAFSKLIGRHEILRTVFKENEEGDIRQFILGIDELGFHLSYEDLKDNTDADSAVKTLVQREINKAFDLSRGPLLRAGLYELSENKWVFVFVMHHIISDGWSMGVLIKELLAFYNAHVRGEGASLSPLGIQYKDYADWQQTELSGLALQSHQDYWQGLLSGELPVLELAGDLGGRPAVKTYNGGIVQCRLSPALTTGLKRLVHEKESTLFMGLLALVNTLLYRYTGQQDIIIGSPVAGREHADLEGQIGFYVNTLALRSRFKGDDSYDELLGYAKSLTLGAYEHQVYPFDALMDSLDLQRDMSRNVLFDVMLVLQNTNVNPSESVSMEGMDISGYSGGEIQSSKFDLCFNFLELGEELGLNLEYNSDIYSREMAERLSLHLEQLLSAVIAAPSVPIRELDYLNVSERDQLLVSFNDTSVSYPVDQTLVSLFEQQVVLNRDAVAVVFEDRSLSYAELNRLSSQLGNCLRNKYGVVPDDLIGICLERSEWLIITILGVLKSGAAYVPVDPDYPQERIDYMLSDSNCKVLIDEAWLSLFRSESTLYAEESPVRLNQPTDLAYVIYTSGSTGRPKGVMIEHGGVVNLILSQQDSFRINEEDNILQFSSISFDASVEQIFVALGSGACLTLIGKEELLDPDKMGSFILENGITHVHTVPDVLKRLRLQDYPSLRRVISGGERCPVELAVKWGEHYSFYNEYGPTETTITAIELLWDKDDKGSGSISIGRPVANTRVYIVSESYGLQGVGVIGEICIAGAGLARGYLNQAVLSSEKFVPNPYRKGERMYKTGDLGRWLSDGNIEYIGRVDDQVKIRGYRIEPGEIQAVLEGHEGVESAVVLSRSLGSSEKELVAYLVGSEELNIASLRTYLGGVLPAYMIPGHYVQLEALPLTTNGKVDKKSLPDPEGLGMDSGVAYVAPRNEVEARLVEVWQEILGKEKIGVKDNFFDLGGHSLKATRLASQIHKIFDVKLGLKELFTHTILEAQALLLGVSSRSLFQGIPLAPLQESYRLSSSQRRLWVLSQFDQANVAYNMPEAYVFEGILDRSGLELAFSKLISRHEILRTVFKEDGDIRQFILGVDETGFHLSYEDLKDNTDADSAVKTLVQQEINQAFDLSRGPLLRAGLYELSENKWVFVYVMHHIISDGWSMGVLVKELLAFYNAHVRGEGASLSPLGIQYKDYADWQQAELSGDSLQSHQDYWQGLFSGELPVLELAGDLGGRPAVKTYNGGIVQRRLSPALTAGLKRLVHEKESTLFMGLLALVNTLLYRYTGQQDIIIGSPVAGREHADLEGQIGFYINTLALRSRFNGEDSYDELLGYAKSLTLGAYEHQVYPFDALVDSLDLQRDMSRTALFDVMLVLQNTNVNYSESERMEGLSISGYSGGEIQSSKFDLCFSFSELGEELGLNLEYNSDIYSREMAERLSLHLEQLLSAVISAPKVPINHLDYLSISERDQLLVGFNDTSVNYPVDQTLVSLFEQQVVLNPDAVAVVFEDRSLSYGELNRLSSQLGNCLRNKYAVVPDDLIGICLERSEWLIITILGVLKSGAAYVPVDPDYPQERIDYMLSDSNCKVVIDEGWLSWFRSESTLYAEESPVRLNQPTDLAYVIYTSGSTGRPKGVMIEHRAVVNLSFWHITKFSMTKDDRGTLYAGIAFDASVWELFPYLIAGACLYVIPKQIRLSVNELSSYYETEKITISFLPTQIGEQFLETGNRSLRHLLVGGDRLNHFSNNTYQLTNNYGPTENTVVSTSYDVVGYQLNIPIGRPISNSSVYILDEHEQLKGIGVIGEICVGGSGLARGYLNQPILSSEKFVPNPYHKGERMYKTGDLGRWLSDGNIEYISRVDDQVKIRGYRIEPGEIQNALEGYEGIESAVVLSRSLGSLEKELVAYLVGSEGLNIASLRTYLSEILPAYMIPGHYVQLEALPLTANGKVDRKSLPDPEGLGMNIGTAYVAARNETEACLIGVWEEILGKEQIGVKDNFFDLGGHSLKATRLASQIHKVFNVKIGLKELFTHTILEEQALLLEASSRSLFQGIPLAPLQESYRLSSSQRRLWVLSQFGEANVAYNIPGVYVFEGALDRSGLGDAFLKLVSRHEILRTVFKENEEGDIRQFILGSDEIGFHLSYEDLKDSTDADSAVKTLVQQEINKAFDLSGGPLLRAGLYELSENKWVFVYVMHHIISDGWSMGVLIKELLAFYNAHFRGEEASLSPLGIQYKDYADWQQAELSGDSLQSHRDYWQGLFSGELPVLELAGDKGGRPAVKTYNGGIVQGRLSPALTAGLKRLVHEKESTLFMGLLALVNTLLYRYTGQEDIIIGSPVAGREHADLEGQIGFYVNTLALRSSFKGEDSYDELLGYAKSLTLGAYEHQVYPFDELVDSLDLQRDMSRSALFDVMLVLQNMDNGDPGLGMEGLSVSGHSDVEIHGSKFDLIFNFSELGEELIVDVEYNSDIYSEEMAERMSLHLEQLLSAVISSPSVPISQLDYLSVSELDQLLIGFNDTASDYAKDKTVIDLFEDQADLNPDKTALVFEEISLSYQELNERSNQFSHYLQEETGIEPGDCVGVLLPRSEWSVISMIGIMKLGCVYVPIDPSLPVSRIRYILEESGSKALIVDGKEFVDFVTEAGGLSVISMTDIPAGSLRSNIGLRILGSSSSFIIYTSGSTGNPKGVEQTHLTLYNLILWDIQGACFNQGQKHLQFSSFSFDSSLHDVFYSLSTGGEVHVLNELLRRDLSGLRDYILSNKIATLSMPYAALKAMFSELSVSSFSGHSIQEIISTGEQLYINGGLRSFLKSYPSVRLYNLYGPSETHVVTGIVYSYDSGFIPEKASIGKPIDNTVIYILDRAMRPVPVGVEGEIFIGGWNLAKGYKGNLAVTAEKFIADPFRNGEIIYRSGDIGKWFADGRIEYVMRRDNQLKINGYRIELGEVESGLRSHEQVEEAIVVAKSLSGGDVELVAYLVSRDELNTSDLRSYLGGVLPGYMIPGHYVQLERLPLTVNGKVDKRSLPAPEGVGLGTGITYIAPRNDTESRLVLLWQNILGKEKIGVKDNFFDLGGHSLKATRLSSQIHKIFHVKVALKSLFSHMVLEEQALLILQAIRTAYLNIPSVVSQPSYALSPAQRRLWILSQMGDANVAYNMPGAFYISGKLYPVEFEKAFSFLIDRHEILRTIFSLSDDGNPMQIIKTSEGFNFSISKVDARDLLNKKEFCDGLIYENVNHIFDLENGPLIKVQLVQLEEEHHLLLVNIHHIIFDGWSLNILVKELLLSYDALRKNKAPDLKPLNIDYKDYAAWQNALFKGERLNLLIDYWKDRLGNGASTLNLPLDFPRPLEQSFVGDVISFTISEQLSAEVIQMSVTHRTSLFTVLFAAYNVFLYKVTGQESIILGTSVAGRNHFDLEDLIGFFINTIAVRTDMNVLEPFDSLLKETHRNLLADYEHQDIPFDLLLQHLEIKRDASVTPLFQSRFVFNDVDHEQLSSDGSEEILFKEAEVELNRAKFELSTNIHREGDILVGHMEFRSDLFQRETIERMSRQFTALLQDIVRSPDKKIYALETINEEEKTVREEKRKAKLKSKELLFKKKF